MKTGISKIEWLDASGQMKEQKVKLDIFEPSDLLVKTTTYGKIYKEDKTAIMVLTEESDDECDYTIIPISCIIDIKELK